MTTSIYQLAEHIDIQHLESQILILDLANNAYFSLNETASFYLEALLAGKQTQTIVEEAMETFEIEDKNLILQDLDAILSQMLENNIIVRT